ncbi:MAG: UDP-N-acetylglucosamine 1-carboxyvinyltransferase [Alphaproteobacteria bacterium]|nr:UDP-N-acetylglucosamine 1-carboxyvinyltransferase [Alphaproteobacteria bacterium]
MDRIRIRGGNRLVGTIPIAGAKNAALPIMAASLLSAEPLTLTNIPHLVDIITMANLLGQHGTSFTLSGDLEPGGAAGRALTLHTKDITSYIAPYDIVRKMRASVLVLGPLLARYGEAKVSLPGGCAIGTRPIDMHLKALEQMGAVITLEGGYVHAHVPQRLKGCEIQFDKVSVGATENLVMAATLADGVTTIHNAAKEPEVTDLIHCLKQMGAKIEGIGTSNLVIEGVTSLRPATHHVVADRIEAGTFAAAAVITGGDILLAHIQPDIMTATLEKFQEAGAEIIINDKGIRIRRDSSSPILPCDLTTSPYPSFPTDMQAQMMALFALSNGASIIKETIFENRFMHVSELTRMGANITITGNAALIRGVPDLQGAEVMATDLRASVSLILAGLVAQGETYINRVYHLDRGYERIEVKLRACGADIERVPG